MSHQAHGKTKGVDEDDARKRVYDNMLPTSRKRWQTQPTEKRWRTFLLIRCCGPIPCFPVCENHGFRLETH